MDPTITNAVEEASSPGPVMATASNSSATCLLLMNILLLLCLDTLYYIHSLTSAPRKFLCFSLRRRSTTVHLSILGLALAVTLHKIVANLVVHHEALVGYARFIGSIFAQPPPVISALLVLPSVLALLVSLAMVPMLKWRPAVRRMLRSSSDAPVEKHVPFARWSFEERLILFALESRRRRQRQQRFKEKDQSEMEKGVAPATQESDDRKAAEPDQVLRENVESRSICALVGLNTLWLLMVAIEWYMASGEFGSEETLWPFFINMEVMFFSFLSWYTWLDCLITWGEALVEVRRARH